MLQMCAFHQMFCFCVTNYDLKSGMQLSLDKGWGKKKKELFDNAVFLRVRPWYSILYLKSLGSVH